jgi:ADP-ribose pyrophosphatase
MTTKTTTVLQTDWFTVEALAPQPEWNVGDRPYYRILSPDSVVVLPITATGGILMVRQYRPARGRITLEIPAGAIEPDETPIQAVARELLEETGHAADTIHFLGRGGLSISRESAWVHAYIAFGVRPQPNVIHRDQGIEAVELNFAEFARIVQAGEFEQLAALSLVTMAKIKFPDALNSLLS